MKTKLLVFVVLMVGALQGFAQQLIPEALKVKTAYERLRMSANSKELQQNYISAFPSDSRTFLKVFMTEKFDQLYTNSYLYIDILDTCSDNFPKEVLSKCIDIGKNLVWNADAVGSLQRLSVNLAIKNPQLFVNKYQTLNDKEQESLINFYADVENHDAYDEYQKLINAAKSIGEIGISKKLEIARTERKKRIH
jgi:hypothetical protein